MASARFVSELARGGRVDGTYLMQTKELRVARTGDAYLSCTLADRSGSMPAVIFRPARSVVDIPIGTVVAVRGTVTSFKGVRRITADEILPAVSWDPDDLLASSNRSSEELTEEFMTLVRSVSNRQLRRLLRAAFADADFLERFKNSPASLSAHHGYRRGLLEHTVAVSWLCRDLSQRYDALDADALLTCSLLHDIGVTDELSSDGGILVSNRGRLIGHEALGAFRIQEAACRVGLSDDTTTLIVHAVLAHHIDDSRGTEGPVTLEALALRRADAADIEMAEFRSALEGAARVGETWTGVQNPFRRSLHTASVRGATRLGEDDATGVTDTQHSA